MNNVITTSIKETITSIEVAQIVSKEHKYLLRDIRRYMGQMNQSKIAPVDFFIETEYIDSKCELRPCFNVTRKGCEFIANKLTGQKGTEFTAKYVNKFHELEEGNLTTSFISALNSISESMKIMRNEINDRLVKLEESTQKKKLPEKKYSRWKSRTFEKLKILMDFINGNINQKLSLPNVVHLVIGETEDLYSIEINEYADLYRCEFGIGQMLKYKF